MRQQSSVRLEADATTALRGVERSGWGLRRERKTGSDGFGNRARTSVFEGDEDPFGLAASEELGVGSADESVVSERADALQAGHPSGGLNGVPRKGGTEILNVMRAHDPGTSQCAGGGGAADRRGVEDGDVLHPLDIDHIVHVPVGIDGRLGDGEPVAEEADGIRFCVHGWMCDSANHGLG